MSGTSQTAGKRDFIILRATAYIAKIHLDGYWECRSIVGLSKMSGMSQTACKREFIILKATAYIAKIHLEGYWDFWNVVGLSH